MTKVATVKKIDDLSDSILDEQYHARLIADIDYYAGIAGIPVDMLHHPMATHCSPAEVDWITNIMLHRQDGKAGLCLTGVQPGNPVETRMMAMGAALLRNYVDARVVTMTTVLHDYEKGEEASPTVMLIPNFYVEYKGGKPSTNWQVQLLQDLLLRRMVEKKITIIYVQSLEGLKTNFGAAIGNFIESHWTVLK